MKLTVVTQFYNSKDYLERCINSVLNQTHTDLEYILVDNASADGSADIAKRFAESDDRVKIVRFEENKKQVRWAQVVIDIGTGDYVAELDSDDWYDPTFLERMVDIAEKTDADIVTTGSRMFIETPRSEPHPFKEMSQPLEITRDKFAEYYTIYHYYFRTYWAKIIRMGVFKKTSPKVLNELSETFGLYSIDTVYTFDWLRKCKKIYLDNSVLHNWLNRSSSSSHNYEPQQSASDLFLYNDAIDYLSGFGEASAQNLVFIKEVYAYAVKNTMENVQTSTLSVEDKIHEYRVILERDATISFIRENSEPFNECKQALFVAVFECAKELPVDNKDINAIKQKFFPNCGVVITQQNVGLFIENETLRNLLMKDYRKPMVKYIVSLIEKQEYAKQYHLGEMLCRLSYSKPISDEISDMKFIRKYREIYLLIWSEKYNDALDKMTDILLKELVPNETFYEVYLSLAASLECADEFVFGKIKQAHYYCDNRNNAKAAELLDEVAEMGIEDNEEIAEIREKI